MPEERRRSKGPKVIDIPGLPPGFDCATIHEKGIDRQENFRAGRNHDCLWRGTGRPGGVTSLDPFSRFVQKLLPVPLAFGAADVDLITGTETFPAVTQSETYTMANPDNPNQIVVTYNDSRSAQPINYSGASVSTDGGTTFTRSTNPIGTGHSAIPWRSGYSLQ